MTLPILARRTYADHVRQFTEQYRKQIDNHVTSAMRQWRAEVGLLANDWLMFAAKLFYISTRQGATHDDDWIDMHFASFLELVDVDSLLAWNATVINR